MNPTVREMLMAMLKAGGFDGLYSPDGGCACKAEDLAPCDPIPDSCRAGYLAPCPGPGKCELDGGCKWHIVAVKP